MPQNIAVQSEASQPITQVKELNHNLIFQEASNIIKQFEGLKLESYLCPAKVLTIGYGTTKGVTPGMKITQEQAEEMLKSDMQVFTSAVLGMVGNICNEYQIASLISFSYNLGINALQKSTLLKAVKQNPQNFKAIEKEFMKWVNAGGKKLEGLVKRRNNEYQLYARTK